MNKSMVLQHLIGYIMQIQKCALITVQKRVNGLCPPWCTLQTLALQEVVIVDQAQD